MSPERTLEHTEEQQLSLLPTAAGTEKRKDDREADSPVAGEHDTTLPRAETAEKNTPRAASADSDEADALTGVPSSASDIPAPEPADAAVSANGEDSESPRFENLPAGDAGAGKDAARANDTGDMDDAKDGDDEEELPLPPVPAPLPSPDGEAEAPATASGGGGGEDLPPAVTHAQDAGQPAPPPNEEPMTLMGHLNELRRRLTRVVIMVLVGFIACYGVAEPIYGWLSEPLKAALPAGSKLIYTSPQGAFFVYLKVALVTSIFATSPFTFYQLWAFIAPGLYKEEKQAIAPLAFFSAFFFLAGASFCYFLVFPIAFQFFMGFATDVIVPMISVEEYLSFALKLLIAFGLVFEMPLFAYFLAKMGLLTPDMMRNQRKYAILAIFIVAAILTPPDVFSQCLMAAPMLVLYEVSIYVAASARKKRDERNTTQKTDVPEDSVHEES